MEIIAHIMEYDGEQLFSDLKMRNYVADDYEDYKRIYEACFFDLRTALELVPVNCCDSKEELLQKQSELFILELDKELVGSVAISDGEIDDLIVAKKFQKRGYGKALVRFAVAYMQKNKSLPIRLHVADWNQTAIQLYLNNGFHIIKTETIS